jgi:O-antigen ligase
MKVWARHGLPALAALGVLWGGPHRERFDVAHGFRWVVLLGLAAVLMFSGRLAVSSWRSVHWAGAAALASVALSAVLASSPAYALLPSALAVGSFAIALGTSWREGDRARWLTWLAFAAVGVAVLGLLEAVGLGPMSLRGRAPSSTMGQRNTLGHFAVLASPLVWAQALRAESRRIRLGWLIAAALVAAVVVCTRSRAAWLAGPTVMICFVLLVRTRAVVAVAASVAVGVCVALAAPVGLRWTEPNPYADTARRLVDSDSASGAGRLEEWRASLTLLRENPLLGVGPGNWFTEYGITHGGDHFAHSDGLAFAVERGGAGAALALGVAVTVLLAWRPRRGLLEFPLVASTVVAAGVLGVFDAVIQLPAPLLWVTLVCFVGVTPSSTPVRAPKLGLALAALTLFTSLSFGSRLLSTAESTPFDRLERAAALDPFDAELRVTLAEAWISAGRCDLAGPHLKAAQRWLPLHPQVPGLVAACR